MTMPPTDSVRIRLFAQVRERAGRDALVMGIADVSTAAHLRAHLMDHYPDLAPLLGRCAVAVNREYVPDHHPIRAGDEVAVIPPVAGG